MTHKKSLTIKTVAQALLDKGLMTEEQYADILVLGEAQTARLQNSQHPGYSRRFAQTSVLPSPAEVISSFTLEIPGGNGKVLTEDAITQVIAEMVGMPYFKIDPLKLDLEVVTSPIPRPFAMKHVLVPVSQSGNTVTIAVADPFAIDEIEALVSLKRIKIKRVLSSKSDILKILREFFGFRASILSAQNESSTTVDLGNLEQFVRMKGHQEIESTDKNIINAVEFILNYAFDQRASDIHIEPKRDFSLIRFRIDGVLHNIHTVPKPLHLPMVSRIKMLSRMDLAEKRRPQDGRIKTNHLDKEVELRVSTLPVAFGEKVVVRIFDPDILMQDLDRIGFYPREYQLYNSFIRKPNGIILVTGPTGSGKTTTLYSTLRTLSSPEVNIVTIEDPIEMVMEEFNQVGVQAGVGVSFDSVLRNILRQDPDIIMVGEIRDRQTAESAVQASLTGHLVLSTLHTNDAPSSITRLLDLGVPYFLIASTVTGVIAQRLVRCLCQSCKRERRLSDEETSFLKMARKPYRVYQGEGCAACRGTGYKGRTGLFEVMDFTDNLRAGLSDRTELSEIQEIARQDGMVTLRQAGIMKMLEGITSYEEIISVT
ncbi:MAG: type II/IV secretion system protein [Deltaproteobacteria bacterium]|nr:type II/IV secretion system protein [Deltaproteobacteria bacterium]